jgi:hypothetical protein
VTGDALADEGAAPDGLHPAGLDTDGGGGSGHLDAAPGGAGDDWADAEAAAQTTQADEVSLPPPLLREPHGRRHTMGGLPRDNRAEAADSGFDETELYDDWGSP